MFNLAINGKLRTCDLIKPRLDDICYKNLRGFLLWMLADLACARRPHLCRRHLQTSTEASLPNPAAWNTPTRFTLMKMTGPRLGGSVTRRWPVPCKKMGWNA
jgi:hypothetical protein